MAGIVRGEKASLLQMWRQNVADHKLMEKELEKAQTLKKLQKRFPGQRSSPEGPKKSIVPVAGKK